MNFTTEQLKDSNGSYSLPFSSTDVIIAASTGIAMFVFGTAANVIIIATVLASRKLKSTFYFLIMSLSISDLISAWVSILTLYRFTWGFDVWYWPNFTCKLGWAANLWTYCVTSLHIVVFAFFRFVSVYWPRSTLFTPKRTKICIAVVWIVCFGVGFVPMFSYVGAVIRDRTRNIITSQWPSCSLNIKDIPSVKIYSAVVYPIMFYVPFFLVGIFSIGLAIKIFMIKKNRAAVKGNVGSVRSAAEEKQNKKENQILLQLALIVGAFFLGYLPITVAHYISLNNLNPTENVKAVYKWWTFLLGYWLLRFCECLNPVFYTLSSSKMRKETKKTLSLVWRKTTQNLRKTLRSQPTSESTTVKVSTYQTSS